MSTIDRLVTMCRAVTAEEESLQHLTRELVRAGYHTPKLEGPMDVQLLGHVRLVGTVEEVAFLGVKFLRVTADDGTWGMYSPQAMYGISPAVEDTWVAVPSGTRGAVELGVEQGIARAAQDRALCDACAGEGPFVASGLHVVCQSCFDRGPHCERCEQYMMSYHIIDTTPVERICPSCWEHAEVER